MPGDAATARNNLAITPSNIGAAPAGYGVGSQVKHLTSADDLHALTIGGRYGWASDAPQNSPGQYLVMDLMFRDQSGTYGVADFYTTSPFAIYQSFGRIIISDGEWGEFEWENPPLHTDKEYRTTERFDDKVVFKKKDSNGKMMYRLDGNSTWIEGLPGAAPSGYGYGGAVPYVTVSDMWTDSSYNTALNDVLSSMKDGEAKQVRVPYIDGTTTLGTVYRATNDYATVVCYGYGTHGFIARKSKYNGSWSNWEWENPPMQPGVEYCTTERYQGNPVYVKLIDAGTLPNNSTKYVESAIDNGIAKVVDVRLNIYSVSGMAQRTNDSRIIVTVNVESPFAWLAITSSEDFSTYTGQVVAKYIK